MRNWRFQVAGLVVLICLGVAVLWSLKKPRPVETQVVGSKPGQVIQPAATSRVAPMSDSTPPNNPSVDPDVAAIFADFEKLVAALEVSPTEEKQALLDNFLNRLRSLSSSHAILAIQQFLKTGKDAVTGQSYVLGEGGIMSEAPTLRVLLLNEIAVLGRKDGTPEGAQTALAASKEIFSSSSSPDEWSVALRNVAWFDKNSDAFLNEKFKELVSAPAWTSRPSTGLLEAFDVPVYTGDIASIPILAGFLVPKTGLNADVAETLARAASVSLDRMSEHFPREVAQYLNNNPAVMSLNPLMRADYYSRANLQDGAQRYEFERYLSRTDVSSEEKTKAIESLVSPGTFASDNLLTTTPEAPDPDARLAILEKVSEEWKFRFPQASAQMKFLLNQIKPVP